MNGFLPRAQKADRLVAFEKIEQDAERMTALIGEVWIAAQYQLGVVARDRQEARMFRKICESKTRQSRLPGPENLAFSTKAQIFFRNTESVFRLP